ncbi:diguanylate cyclase [Sulfurimonas lithotrophica]|uniref:Diguanylate cyclase n=1 Tax=Sulfurimonas lithotrophica TaxID=2590022 RepID=A0A5P8P0K3_9BACT|nr:diguanylate cyclase [Sulfurimonas lithotrophica]QFR49233.1 diguanylate cyclase [Sulfurimonas lithotrophica]
MVKKRVLILEVNEKNFTSLATVLKRKGYESVSYNEINNLDKEIENIDIVLVNTHITYIDISKIYELVNTEFIVKIPIIFLDNSKESNKELIEKCFSNGASDFIKRPFSSSEILARVDYHYDQFYKLREYKLRVDKLANLATVDQLSKLTSKMHMQAILKHQLNNYNRYKTPTSVLYIGLINVDKIVSICGFEYGEKLIQSFSKKLKALIRESDVVSRWKGSNFMVLLSNTDAKNAENLAKKLNKTLSGIEVMKDTKPVLAFGITEFIEEDWIEEIEQRAVYALKQAKKQEYGRIYTC